MTPDFPAIGFCTLEGPDEPEGAERIDIVNDEVDFTFSAWWRLRYYPRLGMVLIGSDLRPWKVVRVVDRGIVGSIGGRILRFLTQQSLHRFEHELVELSPISLYQLKARIGASILADPDHWIDDDPIVDENGNVPDAQDLLDIRVAAVQAAASFDEIMDAL